LHVTFVLACALYVLHVRCRHRNVEEVMLVFCNLLDWKFPMFDLSPSTQPGRSFCRLTESAKALVTRTLTKVEESFMVAGSMGCGDKVVNASGE